MIKTETRQVFITEDFMEFDSEEAAKAHEVTLHIVCWLDEYNAKTDGDLYTVDVRGLAKALNEAFILTPRSAA